MQIMAVVFAVCVFATPALAQYDDGWSPTQEILRGIFDPPKRERPDPRDYFIGPSEQAQRQQQMEYYRNEMNRQNAISACNSIWHNPEAQAACRRSQGGY